MTDNLWIVSKADDKVFSVSKDFAQPYRLLASYKGEIKKVVSEVVGTAEVFDLSEKLQLEDLLIIGTPFQKKVWTELFRLTHGTPVPEAKLHSYSEIAERIGMPQGVRSVAHAIGLNPINLIIPCHLIIPKPTLDRLEEDKEQLGLFGWKALFTSSKKYEYGEYSLGAKLKKGLIAYHLSR